MSVTTELCFRPTEIKISESQYNPPLYRIETHVKFFFDEEMTKLALEKDMEFENVTLNPSWEASLGDVYALINSNL